MNVYGIGMVGIQYPLYSQPDGTLQQILKGGK